jgi:hypothetical protein
VWPRSFIPTILSVLALGVAACGDGGEGAGGKTEIARDIKLAFTTQDEKVSCRQRLTKSFVKRFYGDMAQCLEKNRPEADDKPTTDVPVSNITVDGDTAKARAQFVGGDSDGAAGTVQVRKEGDRWRIEIWAVTCCVRSSSPSSCASSRTRGSTSPSSAPA